MNGVKKEEPGWDEARGMGSRSKINRVKEEVRGIGCRTKRD